MEPNCELSEPWRLKSNSKSLLQNLKTILIFRIASQVKFKILDKCISSFSNLCPVLHSSALEIDIFLRKSFMASFRLKKKLVGMNWHINLIGISSSDWALYSLPRCFFVYNFHTSSRAKNRRSKRQGKTSLSQNFFWKKWNFLNCVDLFFTSRKIVVYLYFFCTRCC